MSGFLSAGCLIATAPAATSATAASVAPAPHFVIPPAARAVNISNPGVVVGNGNPASCTSAAVVSAVAEGGDIAFNCGPNPVTITMKTTAKVVNTSHQIVIDGGGKVTLSGAGKFRILYMNTCDPNQLFISNLCWEQQWPRLVIENMTFEDGYAGTQQSDTASYGGGAIYDEGGQLKVVNSRFIDNRCYRWGPDIGGGAIRAYGMYMDSKIYINNDTFTGNSCSNGGAISGLFANFDVFDSVLTGNKALGWGQNPAIKGTPGGGSGGAIYTDGNHYNLIIDGTTMTGNTANEGGGAIFYVVNSGGGGLAIVYAHLHDNTSGVFQNAPGIFDHVDGHNQPPDVWKSTIY
jgi:hypothetical protein